MQYEGGTQDLAPGPLITELIPAELGDQGRTPQQILLAAAKLRTI